MKQAAVSSSASVKATVRFPDLPSELSGGWLPLLRVFGPGAVIASMTVGTGETIFSPRLGAIFGYSVLWIIVAAVVFKAVLVYTGVRHLVLTGEHPMEAWARLPGPRGWLPILIGGVAMISFPLWVAALSDAVASLCGWVTGVGTDLQRGRPMWSTTIILAAMMLSVVQTYNVVERISAGFLFLKIVFIFAAIVVIHPDWRAAFAGLVTPHLPAYDGWVAGRYPDIIASTPFFHLAVFMGVIGGGVQDYLGYVGLIREKRWGLSGLASGSPNVLPMDPSSVARGMRWLRAPLLDVVCSFACVLVLTACFMILGAAVLHPQMEVPTDRDLYSKQAQFLALVHPSLVAVYKAGIFFAMFGAIYGTFEIYSRTAYETGRAIFPGRVGSYERVRLWITLYSGVGALILLWTGLRTVTIVRITSPLSGVLGCGLWCLAMLWVDRALMPRPYRMRPTLVGLTVLAGVAMVAIGGYTTYRSWTN